MLATIGKFACFGGCGLVVFLFVLGLVAYHFAEQHRRQRKAAYLAQRGLPPDRFLGRKPIISAKAADWDRQQSKRRDEAGADRRAQWELPRLNTLEDLERFLVLRNFNELVQLADINYRQVRRLKDTQQRQRLTNYWRRTIPKRGGGVRRLCAPKPKLKAAQRRLLRSILDRVPVHPAAMAFRRGRGIEDHARAHVGRQIVVALDLEDFFPSIRRGRVGAFFRWLGYPPSVACVLSLLCTTDDGGGYQETRWNREKRTLEPIGEPHTRRVLPQGAPTSPALANAVAFRLDCRLSGLARKFGATYTRYADDLAFSGDDAFKRGLSRFLPLLVKIVRDEGFRAHPDKWRFMRHGRRQQLTGLTVNTKPGLGRREVDALRALLHRASKAGSLDSQNSDAIANFADHITGRVAWVARHHPGKGAKMQAQLAALLGKRPTTKPPSSPTTTGPLPEAPPPE